MNIIIVGGGKVGITLTRKLSEEGHDITVIDNDPEAISNVTDIMDVITVEGNGASMEILKMAGADKMDLLIAVTPQDELNIYCCIVAKKLGITQTIARVRNPEYAAQMGLMHNELGISMAVNPERTAALEISRLLRFPAAIKTESFAKGHVELLEVKIKEDSPLCGISLKDISAKHNIRMLVCAVQTGSDVIIPSGDYVIKAGDKINLTASPRQFSQLFKQLGLSKKMTKKVMIVGGGTLGFYLAQMISEAGMSVTIIEKNREKCLRLTEMLPKAIVIEGDGTDRDLLLEEGIEDMDAFVSLTGLDEENIILAIYARAHGVEKVIAKTNRYSYDEVFEVAGISAAVTPKNSVSNQIVRYVRAMQNSFSSNSVQTLHKIVDEKAEALEFIFSEPQDFLNIPLKELKFKDNILLGCIVRRGKFLIPGGNDSIQLGDSVVVISRSKQMVNDFTDILVR